MAGTLLLCRMFFIVYILASHGLVPVFYAITRLERKQTVTNSNFVTRPLPFGGVVLCNVTVHVLAGHSLWFG